MTQYKIGQVLFVVLKKENRVVPFQIVEELVKRTLEGEIVTYMARLGSSSEHIAIVDIDGDIYESADKLRKVLVDRATTSLNKIIDNAIQKSREWYPTGFASDTSDQLASVRKPRSQKKVSEQPVIQPTMTDADDESFVELSDGTKARVRLPSING